MLKKVFYILFIVSLSTLNGCEKEVGDVIYAENLNPYEGNYTFIVAGEVSGTNSMVLNNRGNFSFFVVLRYSNGSPAYPVTITGSVDLNGALNGTIFRAQTEVGTLSGQLGAGDFMLIEGTRTLSATYGVIRN